MYINIPVYEYREVFLPIFVCPIDGSGGGPWWCQGATTLENEPHMLVFEDGVVVV